MLCNHYYIKKLFNFKGIVFENLEINLDSTSFYFFLEVKKHNCPCCYQQTNKIYDYRIQMIKDISIFGKKTFLFYKKRRYRCKHCNKKFYEKNDFLPKYQRMTNRLIQYIVSTINILNIP